MRECCVPDCSEAFGKCYFFKVLAILERQSFELRYSVGDYYTLNVAAVECPVCNNSYVVCLAVTCDCLGNFHFAVVALVTNELNGLFLCRKDCVAEIAYVYVARNDELCEIIPVCGICVIGVSIECYPFV